MRIDLFWPERWIIIIKSFEHIFRSERQPWMRCPKKVGTGQILVPVSFYGSVGQNYWNSEISFGKLGTAEDITCEFLINSHPIAPCVCHIAIIEKLIKSRDLGRLKSLVRDQRSFQDSKCSGRELSYLEMDST